MDTSKFVKGMLFVWVPLLFFFTRAFVVIWRTRNIGMGAPYGRSGRELFVASLLMLAIVACEFYGGFLLSGAIAKGQLLRNFLAVVLIGVGALFVIVQGVTTAVGFLRTPHS
jgi:hypothetical protein